MSQLNKTFEIMAKHNIIHRDIKLENILVKYCKDNNDDSNINFIVKLSDFGISKQITDKTIAQTQIGTPITMAPEVLKGKYNYKCDLWSIGVIIYKLFFNEYPIEGTGYAILGHLLENENPKLRKTNDTNLDKLIGSLLIKDPEKRIGYKEYFDHDFFKEQINKLNKDIIFNKKDENNKEEDFKNDKFKDNENFNIINDYINDILSIKAHKTKYLMNIYISICYCIEKDNLNLNTENINKIIEDKRNYKETNKYTISKSKLNKDLFLSKDTLVQMREDLNIYCIEYAPKIFSCLRKMDKMKKEKMILSLLPSSNTKNIKNNENKDFISTDDNEFIFKRIDVKADQIPDFLKQIVEYLSKNKRSIIERIYGIYKIIKERGIFKNEEYYYILIKNIIGPYGEKLIIQYALNGSHYDLKGSKDMIINMNKNDTELHGDREFFGFERVLVLNQFYSSQLSRIAIHDANFLSKLGIKDYSLLIIKFSISSKTKELLFGKNYEYDKKANIFDDNIENEENNPLMKYYFPSIDLNNLYVIVIRDYFKFIKKKEKDVKEYQNNFVQLIEKITEDKHLVVPKI